jgi:Flp pilus assembly protein TadG
MRPKAPARPGSHRGSTGGSAPGDKGSMSVELAAVIPALALLLLIVALAGDFVQAQGSVDGAARDAARAASLARNPGSADTLATQAADGDLTGRCLGDIGVSVYGFPALGQSAALGDTVTVTVRCDIDTSIFGVFALPARRTMTGIATAPLDPFMCRGTAC